MRSRSFQFIAAIVAVAIIGVVIFVALPSSKSSSAVTFANLVKYDKSAGACVGVQQTAQGTKVNSNAKADHITGVFSCETKEVLSFIDYFASTKYREAITSSKGFITQASCAAEGYKCGVDYDKNWLFVALMASKPRTAAADAKAIKFDEQMMAPSLVAAGIK